MQACKIIIKTLNECDLRVFLSLIKCMQKTYEIRSVCDVHVHINITEHNLRLIYAINHLDHCTYFYVVELM